MQALEKSNVPQPDYQVVMKFLELVPSDLSLYLDDDLRKPTSGWTFEKLQEESLKYYTNRAARTDQNTGGLVGLRTANTRQRATWNTDRKTQ